MLTGRYLRSYLAYVVLGRRSPVEPRNRPRKGPPRSEAYKEWIRSLPCIGCGREGPSEPAHTGVDGGMSMKASDYSCVPLCRECHTQAPRAYHRIGKRDFETEREISLRDAVEQLNEIWRQQASPNERRAIPVAHKIAADGST